MEIDEDVENQRASAPMDKNGAPATLLRRQARIYSPPNSTHLKTGETLTGTTASRIRRARNSSTEPAPRDPEAWTDKNPEWRDRWHRSLVYPDTGKNRATVDADDIVRLDEGQFLNDNLISFYIRHLQVKLERETPDVLRKVHIFSTFFFAKLRSKGRIDYDGVKSWTAKLDLFSHDYIVVPVNEHSHWYLAIICNVSNALNGVPSDDDVEIVDAPQDWQAADVDLSSPVSSKTIEPSLLLPSKKLDPRQPRIVTLDSLESPHSPTCRALKDYLSAEAKNRKGVELAVIPNGMSAKKIPRQNNYCDCGVFVLGYLEEFLKNPDEAARKLLLKEDPGWEIQPSRLRDDVRSLLFKLQGEQHKRLEREEREKRIAKAEKKLARKVSPQSAANPGETPPALAPLSSASMDSNASAAGGSQSGSCDRLMAMKTEATPANPESPPEPAPIGTLSNTSTASMSDASTSTPNFYSAQESPEVMPSQVSIPATKVALAKTTIEVEDDEVKFVKQLSSSSADSSADDEVPTRRGKAQLPFARSERAATQKNHEEAHNRAATPRQSADSDTGADALKNGSVGTYDGLDRSANPTG